MAKKSICNVDYKETVEDRNVSSFLDDEYRAFSNYVIRTRCCPSLVDGLKTGARKLLHAAFAGVLKDGHSHKMPALIGDCYTKTYYAHGNSSLEGTIMTMSAYFQDNLNALTIDGQGGTLRAPKSYAAPRYLFVKLSKYARLIYGVDYDMLEHVFDEGEYLEPVTYLPIIPTILASASEGMAPGYKFNINVPYNPMTIIDACLDVLNEKKKITTLKPYVRGIKSDSFKFNTETGRWVSYGAYDVDDKKCKLTVTDLPYGTTFDGFEGTLNKLQANGTIKSWHNLSTGSAIHYEVVYDKSLYSTTSPAQKANKLGLVYSIPNDIIYVMDENNKVKHFDSPLDLLSYFVSYRLSRYSDRKTKLVSVKEKQLLENTNLCRFIDLVTSNKLKINNRPMVDIKKDLDKHYLPYELLKIQISKLTKEEKEEILKKNKELEAELAYIKNTTTTQMYINDLKELKKQIASDFKE